MDRLPCRVPLALFKGKLPCRYLEVTFCTRASLKLQASGRWTGLEDWGVGTEVSERSPQGCRKAEKRLSSAALAQSSGPGDTRPGDARRPPAAALLPQLSSCGFPDAWTTEACVGASVYRPGRSLAGSGVAPKGSDHSLGRQIPREGAANSRPDLGREKSDRRRASGEEKAAERAGGEKKEDPEAAQAFEVVSADRRRRWRRGGRDRGAGGAAGGGQRREGGGGGRASPLPGAAGARAAIAVCWSPPPSPPRGAAGLRPPLSAAAPRSRLLQPRTRLQDSARAFGASRAGVRGGQAWGSWRGACLSRVPGRPRSPLCALTRPC